MKAYIDIENYYGETETTLIIKVVNEKIVVEIKDENDSQHNFADLDIYEDGNELYRIQRNKE